MGYDKEGCVVRYLDVGRADPKGMDFFIIKTNFKIFRLNLFVSLWRSNQTVINFNLFINKWKEGNLLNAAINYKKFMDLLFKHLQYLFGYDDFEIFLWGLVINFFRRDRMFINPVILFFVTFIH